ncbi:transposase, IS4 [Saccharomonospora azurea SZMC 14600]|nr:transposase, IS4 [Saccharomonospora azurea SZMC 14600]
MALRRPRLRLRPPPQTLRAKGIIPRIARKNTEHGSGLGKVRWVVERTFAWLHQFKRLRTRYEQRAAPPRTPPTRMRPDLLPPTHNLILKRAVSDKSPKKGANTQVRAPWTGANRVPRCTSCRTRTDCPSSSASRPPTPTTASH